VILSVFFLFVFLSCPFQSRSGHLRESVLCWKAKMDVKRIFSHSHLTLPLHQSTLLKRNLRWNVCRCHGHCQFHLKPIVGSLWVGYSLAGAFGFKKVQYEDLYELNQQKHLLMENIGIRNFVVCGNYYNPVVLNLYGFCGT